MLPLNIIQITVHALFMHIIPALHELDHSRRYHDRHFF